MKHETFVEAYEPIDVTDDKSHDSSVNEWIATNKYRKQENMMRKQEIDILFNY